METKRFILREIWISWSTVLNPTGICLVVSGTGIDCHAPNETFASSACKEYPYEPVHDISTFGTPGDQPK